MVGLALLVASAVGMAAFVTAQKNSQDMIEARMGALLQAKSHELELYLTGIEQDLRVVSENPTVIEAIHAFDTAWDTLGSGQGELLQKAYIEDNPHPLGEKEKLDTSTTAGGYDAVHGQYHPWLRKLLKERQYYDIFLFDLDGNLVYTVFKELDYATNLNRGKYKNTDLGNAFRAAADSSAKGSISFFDFKPYAPSHGAPASFMSTPIFDGDRKVGVLVFQMPIDVLNELMSSAKGLGTTGEVMIVGADNLMRNDSLFTKDNDILKTSIENSAVSSAIGGSSGQTIATGYRNLELDFVAMPFVYQGTKWALVAAQDTAEINAPVISMGQKILLITLVMIAISGAVGLFLSRSITRRIVALVGTMTKLAQGDTDVELAVDDRQDEIGDMSRTVTIFRDNALERAKLQYENDRNSEAGRDREHRVDALIAQFKSAIAVSIGELGSNSVQMKDTVAAISDAATATSTEAGNANAASDDASQNVQAVAAAAEELTASIGEISMQITETNNIVDRAATAAEVTDAKVGQLSGAAQKIGEVVSLIEDIAAQTNLLALNATIEAARAGEAGKGFAVVASEVKNLATQTAGATESIGEQIKEIQSETDTAVAAIQEISEIMKDVTGSSCAIAAAIEQQGVATAEISRNVNRAAMSSNTVSESMSGVTSAASETAHSISQIEHAAEGVETQANQLRSVVDKFLVEVAAA